LVHSHLGQTVVDQSEHYTIDGIRDEQAGRASSVESSTD
jgi:hypothetical protein